MELQGSTPKRKRNTLWGNKNLYELLQIAALEVVTPTSWLSYIPDLGFDRLIFLLKNGVGGKESRVVASML